MNQEEHIRWREVKNHDISTGYKFKNKQKKKKILSNEILLQLLQVRSH